MAQRHLDRLTPVDASFLHQEGPTSHMHVGGLTIVEGPPPAMDEFLEQIRRRLHLVPRYRHKLASHRARQRAPGVGRRSELQPRVPHPPHRAADPGRLGAAAGPDGADLLPAARPLQAAVGDVADRGPEGRPLRADLKEPPRADRRHRRDRPGDGAVRPLARTRRRCDTPGAPGSRTPSPASPSSLAAGLRGAVRAGHRARGGRARRARRTPITRSRARARPPRASARSSGPG